MDTFESRRDEFLSQYGALVKEFEVDFISVPAYIPNEQGTWSLVVQGQVVDKKDQPTPSPIVV